MIAEIRPSLKFAGQHVVWLSAESVPDSQVCALLSSGGSPYGAAVARFLDRVAAEQYLADMIAGKAPPDALLGLQQSLWHGFMKDVRAGVFTIKPAVPPTLPAVGTMMATPFVSFGAHPFGPPDSVAQHVTQANAAPAAFSRCQNPKCGFEYPYGEGPELCTSCRLWAKVGS